MKPLPKEHALELSHDLTRIDKQSRYVVKSQEHPGLYVIITEHEVDPRTWLEFQP